MGLIRIIYNLRGFNWVYSKRRSAFVKTYLTKLLLLPLVLVFMSCEDEPLTDDLSSGSYALGLSADGRGSGEYGGNGSGNVDSTQYEAGVITAGEWDDLKEWDYWVALMDTSKHEENRDYWEVYPKYRYDFQITNGSRWPVANAILTLHHQGEEVWATRTDNEGMAVAWAFLLADQAGPDRSDLSVKVNGELIADLTIKNISQGVNEIELPDANRGTDKLDVAFVVDATGSMADELEYLKVEVRDVIERVKSDYPGTNLRMGSVFYRDIDDQYLTRIAPLSPNISNTVDFIKAQSADGGGDFPEAVHTALDEAITELDWAEDAKSRVLFLILDAPPHYTPQVVDVYKDQIAAAARKGIKVIPVTASGIDKNTEFLMRFTAMSTNGTYTFITDHSGIGGDHLEATVGEYEVEFLNDLMVRLIGDLCKTEPVAL